MSANSAFVDALRYGAILIQSRFTLYENGASTGQVYYAATSTGSFTDDRLSNIRRTGQITIEVIPGPPAPFLMPIAPTSALAPFGNEVYIECGIASSNNSRGIVEVTQWVPLGLYTIMTSDVDDTTIDCVVTLNLSDRAAVIASRSLQQPYNFPAASGNFVEEVTLLANQVWNQTTGVAPLQFNITPTNATVPIASYGQGSDPWQALLDMANVVGYELYFSAYGVLTGHPIPNPYTTPPTWYFTDSQTDIMGLSGTGGSSTLFGGAYSTPIEVQIQMTRQGIYNDIQIQGTGTANAPSYTGPGGTSTGSPILATAANTNLNDPANITGGLGVLPNFVQSSLILDVGAQAMANNLLQASLSKSWTLTMQIPPNPILEVDDVLVVTRPRVGLYNAYVVIDTISHAIKYADATTFTGRILSNNNTLG